MAKSEYLETLEKLQNALTLFDMSFGVSNKIFRFALVSEFIDTSCLFEQLYESWCEHLPFGEGPDADVDFSYWKELTSWETLLSNAKQNACIDDFPFDMGNGMTSDRVFGNRRKNYLKSINSIFRRSKYYENEAASAFVKTINGDQAHMMFFGNMVHRALDTLLSTLAKIENHLENPPKALYTDYFERQKSRFGNTCNSYEERIRDILNENLSERRKCNRLNALKDEILQNLYNSDFLSTLRTGVNSYDIKDFRKDYPDMDKTEDEIRNELALEELVNGNVVPNKEKVGQYIFENRKMLSFDDISAFYIYLNVFPIINSEVEHLNGERESKPTQEINSDICSGMRQEVAEEIKDRTEHTPKRRVQSTFTQFINDSTQIKNVLRRLHELIDGKKPKQCAMTIFAAQQKGLITQPSYKALYEEFPEIGDRKNFSYYVLRKINYIEDINSIERSI